MTEIVKVNYPPDARDPLTNSGLIDGDNVPYLLVHDNRTIGRIRCEHDALFLKQAWAMRDMLTEVADLTPDTRIGVDRMRRINELLALTEKAPG